MPEYLNKRKQVLIDVEAQMNFLADEAERGHISQVDLMKGRFDCHRRLINIALEDLKNFPTWRQEADNGTDS